jgi:hypothetical protein
MTDSDGVLHGRRPFIGEHFGLRMTISKTEKSAPLNEQRMG